jgi:hypothetical protein
MGDTCPKCGSSKIEGDECLHCGIVISKYSAYLATLEQKREAPAAPAGPRWGPVAMAVLVAILVVSGLAYFGYRRLSPGITVVDTGAKLILTKGRTEEGFARGDEFRGVFMVFGGNRASEFGHAAPYAFLGGLPLSDARLLSTKFADFYMCGSPGAAFVKEAVVAMHLVATDPATRERIDEAISNHDDRLARGGERLCVMLAGRRLRRTSYRLDGRDAVITDLTPFTYVAVQEFDAQNCKPLLTAGAGG